MRNALINLRLPKADPMAHGLLSISELFFMDKGAFPPGDGSFSFGDARFQFAISSIHPSLNKWKKMNPDTGIYSECSITEVVCALVQALAEGNLRIDFQPKAVMVKPLEEPKELSDRKKAYWKFGVKSKAPVQAQLISKPSKAVSISFDSSLNVFDFQYPEEATEAQKAEADKHLAQVFRFVSLCVRAHCINVNPESVKSAEEEFKTYFSSPFLGWPAGDFFQINSDEILETKPATQLLAPAKPQRQNSEGAVKQAAVYEDPDSDLNSGGETRSPSPVVLSEKEGRSSRESSPEVLPKEPHLVAESSRKASGENVSSFEPVACQAPSPISAPPESRASRASPALFAHVQAPPNEGSFKAKSPEAVSVLVIVLQIFEWLLQGLLALCKAFGESCENPASSMIRGC